MDDTTATLITELASSITLTGVLAFLMFHHLRQWQAVTDRYIKHLEDDLGKQHDKP